MSNKHIDNEFLHKVSVYICGNPNFDLIYGQLNDFVIIFRIFQLINIISYNNTFF